MWRWQQQQTRAASIDDNHTIKCARQWMSGVLTKEALQSMLAPTHTYTVCIESNRNGSESENRIKKSQKERCMMQWDSFILEWNLFIFFYSSDHLSVSYLSLFRSIHRTAFNCFSCFAVFLLKWVNKCVLVRGWVKLSTVHILWCVSMAIWDLLPHTYYTRVHTHTPSTSPHNGQKKTIKLDVSVCNESVEMNGKATDAEAWVSSRKEYEASFNFLKRFRRT